MKKVILGIVVITFGIFACTQTPPKQVSEAFNKKFNNTSNLKWEQEEENEWEAEFKMNGEKASAIFDANSTWLETETNIAKKDIPAEVQKAINLQFEDWNIEKAEIIETPEFKGYEILLDKEETETEILVTAAGEITIKKTKTEEEEEHEKMD